MSPLNTISDFAEMREGASHIQEIPRERERERERTGRGGGTERENEGGTEGKRLEKLESVSCLVMSDFLRPHGL